MEEKLVLKGEKVLGEVLVSVRYDTDKRGVDVNVVQALGLPVMDKIGEPLSKCLWSTYINGRCQFLLIALPTLFLLADLNRADSYTKLLLI